MTDRSQVLTEFDRSRDDFEASLRRAPDAALRFKPQGEDYTVGGLVVHVTDVLRRYTLLIDALRAHGFEAFQAPDYDTPAEDAALIRAGYDGAARGPQVEEMRSAHAALRDAAQSLPESEFTREASVTFGDAPYPTSVNHVVGWVVDHYKEHIQQVDDLVSTWAEVSR